MADFLPGSLYVDQPQTGTAVRRFQTDENFLAAVIAPRLTVRKPSGQYTVWNMAELNRDELEARGPNGRAKAGSFSRSLANFATDARSLAYNLNDATMAAADVDSNPDVMIPMTLGYKALLSAEHRLATAFFVAGAWHRTVTGAASTGADGGTAMNRLYFDDAAQDPTEAFGDEIRIQGKLTGRRPTGLAFGSRLWHKVRNHPKIRATLTTGNQPLVGNRPASLEQMASLLELKWCGVSQAIRNTALTNLAATNEFMVPEDSALLFYSPTAGMNNGDANMVPNTDEPSALARFVWNGVASGEGIQIRRVRDELAGPGGSWTSIIDVYNGYGVVTSEMGTFFTGMVTP